MVPQSFSHLDFQVTHPMLDFDFSTVLQGPEVPSGVCKQHTWVRVPDADH